MNQQLNERCVGGAEAPPFVERHSRLDTGSKTQSVGGAEAPPFVERGFSFNRFTCGLNCVGGAEAPPFVERDNSRKTSLTKRQASVGQKPHPSLSEEAKANVKQEIAERRWGRSPTLR